MRKTWKRQINNGTFGISSLITSRSTTYLSLITQRILVQLSFPRLNTFIISLLVSRNSPDTTHNEIISPSPLPSTDIKDKKGESSCMWYRSVRLLEIFQTFSSSFHLEKISHLLYRIHLPTLQLLPLQKRWFRILKFEEVTFRASVFRFLFFIYKRWLCYFAMTLLSDYIFFPKFVYCLYTYQTSIYLDCYYS